MENERQAVETFLITRLQRKNGNENWSTLCRNISSEEETERCQRKLAGIAASRFWRLVSPKDANIIRGN